MPDIEPKHFENMTQLLTYAHKRKASDLHLSAGLPAMMRIEGDMQPIKMAPLDNQQVQIFIHSTMSQAQQATYEQFLEIDYAFAVPDLARFRVNAFNQNRGTAAVFRTIPSTVLSLQQLGLSEGGTRGIFKKIADFTQGLVLITGPTGSGKSTTLAALLDHINESRYAHILTIEDPIEFIHESKLSLINQRELNRHTLSFDSALKSALREDPDVIMVGELRDLETIRLALTAAETGQLVFATLHTNSAAKTIDRLVDVFPANEQQMIRAMISESLQATVSQVLIKKIAGGRVAAHEIMISTPAIRHMIRENKLPQMYSAIQTGAVIGMVTLDYALKNLLKQNIITKESAKRYAKQPDSFDLL